MLRIEVSGKMSFVAYTLVQGEKALMMMMMMMSDDDDDDDDDDDEIDDSYHA